MADSEHDQHSSQAADQSTSGEQDSSQDFTPAVADTPADPSAELNADANHHALEDIAPGGKTHPLPSDISVEGGDSTGGNAPFAPTNSAQENPNDNGAA